MFIVPREFFNRSPLLVAPELLGKILVRRTVEQEISGRIIEVEAYMGFEDQAAHSFRGKTKLTELTSGPGKLCQAMQIGIELYGLDLTDQLSNLYIKEDGFTPEHIWLLNVSEYPVLHICPTDFIQRTVSILRSL